MFTRHALVAAAALCALVPALAQDTAPSSSTPLRATGAYPIRQDTSQWLGSNLIGAKVVSASREKIGRIANLVVNDDGAVEAAVDADFRRPSVHQMLGAWPATPNSARVGLSNVIVGSAKLDDVVLETQFEHLGLVSAGAIPPNPNELLGSRRMASVMKELTEMADIVLIDTPTCLLYSDAFVISHLVDGVLYVLRAGGQNKAAQRRVQRQLQQSKARLLGVVFNGVDVQDGSSAYDYYGYQANGRRRK